MNPLLITGTDTEVGKTVLTTALIAYVQKYRDRADLGVMKLAQAGEGDGEWYRQLFSFAQAPETLVPLKFPEPIAPPLAAARAGMSLDLTPVWHAYQTLQQQHPVVLVEGVGGLGSPVTDEFTVADIAAAWGMSAILVVPIKLGAIGQTIANVALARQVKLPIQGLVLNGVSPVSPEQQANWAPIALLERFTHLPVLGTLPYLNERDRANPETLAAAAAQLDLERLPGLVKIRVSPSP